MANATLCFSGFSARRTHTDPGTVRAGQSRTGCGMEPGCRGRRQGPGDRHGLDVRPHDLAEGAQRRQDHRRAECQRTLRNRLCAPAASVGRWPEDSFCKQLAGTTMACCPRAGAASDREQRRSLGRLPYRDHHRQDYGDARQPWRTNPRVSDYLSSRALGGPARLQLPGAPVLVFDPATQTYAGSASLKPLLPYVEAVIRRVRRRGRSTWPSSSG